MKFPSDSPLGAAVALVLLLRAASAADGSAAAGCGREELLAACQGDWAAGRPSAGCCAKMREQEPCYCQYVLKYPGVKEYTNSLEGRRFFVDCDVAFPEC